MKTNLSFISLFFIRLRQWRSGEHLESWAKKSEILETNWYIFGGKPNHAFVWAIQLVLLHCDRQLWYIDMGFIISHIYLVQYDKLIRPISWLKQQSVEQMLREEDYAAEKRMAQQASEHLHHAIHVKFFEWDLFNIYSCVIFHFGRENDWCVCDMNGIFSYSSGEISFPSISLIWICWLYQHRKNGIWI